MKEELAKMLAAYQKAFKGANDTMLALAAFRAGWIAAVRAMQSENHSHLK